MLKNIRLHIEKDDEKQKLLDEKLAASILECQKINLNSFARNIPSLMPFLSSSELQNHSLFCNKFGEINIVNYGLGRTLYGFHPSEEISKQVQDFEQYAPYISVLENATTATSNIEQSTSKNTLESSDAYIKHFALTPAPAEIDCLVVLGCGLGLHILELVQNKKINYLIIYEPEPQYFKCSTLVTQWNKIFEIAKTKGTQLFIQVEKDGRDLLNDIEELKTHTNIDGFYLYKHYNHSVFNSLHKELTSKPWNTLVEQGISFTLNETYNQYIPIWTPPISLKKAKDVSTKSKLFNNNLSALKKYYPDIYAEFKSYQPKTWLPIQNQQSEINVIKKDSLSTWYSDTPKADCDLNFDNFNEQPNKDGLVLGYNGTKLAHYIHYQFVKETEELLKQAEEEVGALPDNVPSIIMFGLGVGYQVEKLLKDHTVEKLFICEPNPDFFYASLFAIDWQNIFETVEKSDARIYLNIGDDGTNLFRDLLSQFYSIGPYILNSTYFYQSYYNASLNKAISQLREQLQVVISMGEYFDHAYYGIEHTKEGMRRNIPILTANPAEKLSYDDKEVPIFIVGNGPSLDSSIEAIKEWQGQAIIVSCGTALQALHRHNITPDFHAEIEQNRSTFDWAVLIGDLEYLKNITLLSCNGIHPDTCDLYKDVMVAFKEGESSTISALNVLGREHYEVLQNAFPTVSNFVCDLVSKLGFTTIYLLGVDLGFVSVKHHHSKSSGYYQEDGQETYDYAEKNNTSLIVPGNFRPTVNTKHEFKVSRQVIEQVTSAKPKDQAFYNCSDGAKIQGTLPIRTDDFLIVSTVEQKQQVLELLKTIVFSTNGLENYTERFEQQFSQSLLIQELDTFEALLEKEVASKEDVEYIINTQKEILFASYKNGKSLLFYYLYGTVNYANALLTKLANKESENIHKTCILIIEKWLKTVKDIKKNLLGNTIASFDVSNSRLQYRVKKYLELTYKGEKLVVITDSKNFKSIIKYSIKEFFPWLKNIEILTFTESFTYKAHTDYLIYHLSDNSNIKKTPQIKSQNTLVITSQLGENIKMNNNFNFMCITPPNKETAVTNELINAHLALECCQSNHKNSLILPKFFISDDAAFNERPIDIPIENYYVYEYPNYLCVYPQGVTSLDGLVSGSATRGKVLTEKLKMKHLIQERVAQKIVDETQKKHTDLIKDIIKKIK